MCLMSSQNSELKEIKLFLKYDHDLKIFRAMYDSYRDIMFTEGNQCAWDYMNDGTFKSETNTLRELIFNPENLKDLLAEHSNVF